MRSFRQKPVGWVFDSHRHALAARGMKTSFATPRQDRWRLRMAMQENPFNAKKFQLKGYHALKSQEEIEDEILDELRADRVKEFVKRGYSRLAAEKEVEKEEIENEEKGYFAEKEEPGIEPDSTRVFDTEKEAEAYRQELRNRSETAYIYPSKGKFVVFVESGEYYARKRRVVLNPRSARSWDRFIKQQWKDKLKGGLADRKKPSQFNQKELRKGIKVEREHTSDPHIAAEVAMDHLTEDSKYYRKLAKMEGETGHKTSGRVGRYKVISS